MSVKPRARCVAARPCRGWTLVEALTALAILVIVVAQAVPSMRQLIARQRQQAASSQLQAHLALTRSAALAGGVRVTMSPLGDDWNSGWRIYRDGNASGAWDEGEVVLAQQAAVREVKIAANGPLRRYVTYDPDGAPVQINGAFLAGTWRVCAPGASVADRLVLSASGRVRHEAEQGGECS